MPAGSDDTSICTAGFEVNGIVFRNLFLIDRIVGIFNCVAYIFVKIFSHANRN